MKTMPGQFETTILCIETTTTKHVSVAQFQNYENMKKKALA